MKREQRQNKKLTEEFPFLLPHNKFSGRIPDAYEYEYTELDMLPEGWKKAFGLDMVKELRAILIKADYLEEYQIADIKEKYGVLCWYDNGVPEAVTEEYKKWQRKYEELSAETCVKCGRTATQKVTRWTVPVCDKCLAGKDELI